MASIKTREVVEIGGKEHGKARTRTKKMEGGGRGGRAFGSFPAMILPGLQISLVRLQPLGLGEEWNEWVLVVAVCFFLSNVKFFFVQVFGRGHVALIHILLK